MIFQSYCESQTEDIAARLASRLGSGAFVALRGDLGAGKTAFARGFVRQLGSDDVSSPTFSIVHEYDCTPPVYHFDVYRLAGVDDLESIGFDDYLRKGGVILMEWPERIEEALPFDRIEVKLKAKSENIREITISKFGDFQGYSWADLDGGLQL